MPSLSVTDVMVSVAADAPMWTLTASAGPVAVVIAAVCVAAVPGVFFPARYGVPAAISGAAR